MARRKQLRGGQLHKSTSSSSSASPASSLLASPSATPTAAETARASHSPGKTLSAAMAFLRQSTTAPDTPASSLAVPAAASHSSAPAQSTAPTRLLGRVHAQADTLNTPPTGAASEISDAPPHPNQTCLLSADLSISGHPAARQATESFAIQQPAGALSDAELGSSQQRSAQSDPKDPLMPQPTAGDQPISASGLRLQTCAEQPVSRCAVMSFPACQQHSPVLVGCTGSVSAVKPHPRTAFARPGSHQGVVLSPQAVVPRHNAKTVMSHRLDFSQCTDDDAGE